MSSNERRKNRPLLGFYILVAYVVLQFSWWAYLMFDLNNEIYQLKTELNIIKSTDPGEATIEGNKLQQKLHARWAMITGEGTVFFVLLISGIVVTRSSFKKETALNRQQSNFILSITHELRSPLASAKLQMETLLKRELSKEKQCEILEGSLSDIERLGALVENILLAARIEDSTFSLHREKTELAPLISSLLDPVKMKLRDHRELKLRLETGLYSAIDLFSFPSILLNLYENAVKYSQENSMIEINLRGQGGDILLTVRDHGIGISDADKEQVFKKFFRAGMEETRSTKGTGLGLYIVDNLTRLHQGSIRVYDNKPRGSVFELSLKKYS
jgi:two-component system phosphate regulon sensor histidine kinase PhoR